ncbi:hypothetical protein H8S90_08255 [Olivibacter sp. SDN3]|uniref:GH116 family glycosyl hydrolase n=1 Tax=Olivibacter sp. SDN3 TaxID=2764720 RepID=UPI0016511855|nr:GH116 family glycosyl hydrolase [Olivibacter sp. SDN3]QNL51551.1 hypothetical protein H8S90_08255 [Olivibacter sp. SDN3]
MQESNRRTFIKKLALGGAVISAVPHQLMAAKTATIFDKNSGGHKKLFRTSYTGEQLQRIAFPIGGMGAGMFCLEGTGAISHLSIRHRPEMFFEPCVFAAIRIKGKKNGTRILEQNVPAWKKFGQKNAALGGTDGSHWGLPRFRHAAFEAQFPFASITLTDPQMPLEVSLKGWSPFVPSETDDSSLPVGALEYTFKNMGTEPEEYIFSYNAKNVIAEPKGNSSIRSNNNGFTLSMDGIDDNPEKQGYFTVYTDDEEPVVKHAWFRGFRRDALSMLWKTLGEDEIKTTAALATDAPGASLFIPFKLAPGELRTFKLMFAWYFPETVLREGDSHPAYTEQQTSVSGPKYYKPWYSVQFKNIDEVAHYWKKNYVRLYEQSTLFKKAFFDSTLPSEVLEAVSANLSILKSPTILRQHDGRLWAWEGCGDDVGSCWGSCTHVWNYAQALPHLFPDMERSFRETEFHENQDEEGHQGHRANLPISPLRYNYHMKAADGQLGGIMKVYRDWRICGDTAWLRAIYPKVKASMDYCIRVWDPKKLGVMEGDQLNTYDQAFWGPNGMCMSIYLGALKAMICMGRFFKDDVRIYEGIFEKAKAYLEQHLFNGAYFVQEINWPGLTDKAEKGDPRFVGSYTADELEIVRKEGPKYQYGDGCLSDGILGSWLSEVCGLGNPVNPEKVKSHLLSVYKYNQKSTLHNHGNTQRATYANGEEAGLVLCSWPKGNRLSLPFYYCDEVWTGVEYQVASHLIFTDRLEEGLEIVRACRSRYDGSIRNPFNEYEYGHWYARSLSSYSLLQALTGIRYDAVDNTLFIDSKIGDFTAFIATATGFGQVHFFDGEPALQVFYGDIVVEKIVISGKEMA